MADNLHPLPAEAERARREILCRVRPSRRPFRLPDLGMFPHAGAYDDLPTLGQDEQA